MKLRHILALLALTAVLPACADSSAASAAASGTREAGARRSVISETLDSARLADAYTRAAELPRLRSLLVEWRDTIVGERYWRGAARDRPANIKSASKSVISALVGIAIDQKRIRGLDATIAELLPAEARTLDSAKRAITVEDLVSMRSGLQSTSFGDYGAFVTSRNWVRYVLSRPMVADPGGPMIYSTGSTHLLSAILTRATKTSTLRYAQQQLARPLGIPLRPWTTDPQGIYFGGNEMRMTPGEMLAFGRLYLQRGRTRSGRQVVPEAWIDSSWVPRGVSPWNGHSYGYGWWIREAHGHPVYFAWGYGGQFIFIVPTLKLLVVTTSDANTSRDGGHLEAIHSLVDDHLIPAVSR
ncbi:MAG TPA: serine hydrolase [Gemmatimonadaceae bacterium]|nr:serine hydrolase [Gemmatimonadaceae bacterium]